MISPVEQVSPESKPLPGTGAGRSVGSGEEEVAEVAARSPGLG